MRLTDEEIAQFDELGYLALADVFSPSEAERIRLSARADLAADTVRRTREAGGGPVRASHGAHLTDPFFRDLIRMPRLLDPVTQLLSADVYVHQFKINAKAALRGQPWEWHQDSFFWNREDGMPDDQALNVAVHLDEATEFNGPLLVVPRSHRVGEIPAADESAGMAGADAGDWERTLSAKLKYTMDRKVLTALIESNGITSIQGGPGTVLLFHPSLVHGSVGNLTPYDRCLLIISYNRCTNRLRPVPAPRPEFLAGRDFSRLAPLAYDALPGQPAPAPVDDRALAAVGEVRQ